MAIISDKQILSLFFEPKKTGKVNVIRLCHTGEYLQQKKQLDPTEGVVCVENPFYKAHQEGELVRSINERKNIIDYYLRTHYIDRNHAIQKIMELRNQDTEINVITSMKQAGKPTISLDACSDQQLALELNDQVKMLDIKLAKNSTELSGAQNAPYGKLI